MGDIFLLQKDALVMHISNVEKITKDTTVSVPNNYFAFAIIDGKPMFNIPSCEKLNIINKYGSSLHNKEISVCYVSKQTYEFMWGFGNAEICRADRTWCYFGANGTYQVTIYNPVKFYSAILHDVEQEGLRNLTVDFVKIIVENSYTRKLWGKAFEDAELLSMGDESQAKVNEEFITYNQNSRFGTTIDNIRINKTICNKKESEV